MEEGSAERKLHCAIITQAINDACEREFRDYVFTAFDYLLTPKSDTHLMLIDIDPIAFREGLIKGMNGSDPGVSKQVMDNNRSKRNFRINHEIYKTAIANPVKYTKMMKERKESKGPERLTNAEYESIIQNLKELNNESI